MFIPTHKKNHIARKKFIDLSHQKLVFWRGKLPSFWGEVMGKKNEKTASEVRLFRRKVLKINNSYYISLPMPWIRDQKVEKGDILALIYGKDLKVVTAE